VEQFFGLIMQFLHGLAALVWIGGTLFYVLVIKPTLQGSMPETVTQYTRQMATVFRGWVSLSITLLLVTGISLTAWRLTSHTISLTYITILTIKILIATVMFIIVTRGSNSSPTTETSVEGTKQVSRSYFRISKLFSGANLTLILGMVVFFLADALGMLVEIAASSK
jgi:uncharacterized membrane protein